MESDFDIALRLGRNRRDEALESLNDIIKRGALNDKREGVIERIDAILTMNESISMVEKAAKTVEKYKENTKNT